MFNLFLSLS